MEKKLKRVARLVADSGGTFTEGQLRWWLFNAEANGLAELGAIVRIGRTVYIDVDAFNKWLAAHASNAQAAAA